MKSNYEQSNIDVYKFVPGINKVLNAENMTAIL